MTTLRTPVLTDEDIKIALAKAGFSVVVAGRYALEAGRAIEQAVLERAGADAVRDATLEEAARLMNPCDDEGTLGAMNAASIRALKVTPAAAVADAQPVAWMDPQWNDVITADQKSDRITAYGNDCRYTLPLYAAPQVGQLSGKAGEVDVSALLALLEEIANANSAQVAPVYANLARAAIAASKGPKP